MEAGPPLLPAWVHHSHGPPRAPLGEKRTGGALLQPAQSLSPQVILQETSLATPRLRAPGLPRGEGGDWGRYPGSRGGWESALRCHPPPRRGVSGQTVRNRAAAGGFRLPPCHPTTPSIAPPGRPRRAGEFRRGGRGGPTPLHSHRIRIRCERGRRRPVTPGGPGRRQGRAGRQGAGPQGGGGRGLHSGRNAAGVKSRTHGVDPRATRGPGCRGRRRTPRSRPRDGPLLRA